MNFQKMMQQAQQMQKKLADAQEKVGTMEAEGASGGGMVKIVMTGKGEAKKVTIDPKIVDPTDVEMLEDLVKAAINAAKESAEKLANEEMSKVTSGMPLPPGFKMPF